LISSFSQVPCHLTPRSHSVLVKDPNLFDDPETFNPSRFLTPQKPAGNWNGKVESDFTIPFGFGRRVCPGMHVALQSIFVSLARCVSRTLLNTSGLYRSDYYSPSLILIVTFRQDFLGVRRASRSRRQYHRSHENYALRENARTCAVPVPCARTTSRRGAYNRV
jgi:hypothetical protein